MSSCPQGGPVGRGGPRPSADRLPQGLTPSPSVLFLESIRTSLLPCSARAHPSAPHRPRDRPEPRVAWRCPWRLAEGSWRSLSSRLVLDHPGSRAPRPRQAPEGLCPGASQQQLCIWTVHFSHSVIEHKRSVLFFFFGQVVKMQSCLVPMTLKPQFP